jgi:antitoxin VapB
MSLNIKNPDVLWLAEQVASLTGETKTEAIRRALEERKARLDLGAGVPGREGLLDFLREEIWAGMPPEALGKELSKREEEELLGYGEHGA